MVLGSLGAREFARDLAPLLSDPQVAVRRSAAYALGRFGAVEFASQLRVLLKDRDPEVRLTAAQALGQLGSEFQTDEIVGLLRDADSSVCWGKWTESPLGCLRNSMSKSSKPGKKF